MTTPIRSASSALLKTKIISPRSPNLLSPLQRKAKFSAKKLPGQKLNFSEDFHEPCLKNNAIQIKITEQCSSEDSLIFDSPHKSEILNNGLNKYDLLYLLGKGSFGTVIKGKYHGIPVAVKLIKMNRPTDVANENNARNFTHENIIKVLDIIVSQKYTLIMMEYEKDSRNLQCVLDDFSIILDRNNVIKFTKDVASGLKYCHENGVLHLDVKPKNILLCNNRICKICDFGNSVRVSDVQVFKFQGTVAFTAPEILRGKKPTTKSDIYSMGILIWQMMFRKYPYEFLNSEIVIYKVVKFNFRPPLDITSSDLSKLCSVCWEANPEKRPSAAELCDLLPNLK